MWFYLDLMVCLAGVVWSMVATFRARCFFSLQNVAWSATLMFFFVRPIFEPFRYRQPMGDAGYNLMFLAGMGGLFVASYLIPFNSVESCGFKPAFRPFRLVILLGTAIYFLYALGILWLAYRHAGSLIGVFQQPLVERSLSSDRYLEGKSFWALAVEMPKILFLLGVYDQWQSGRRLVAAGLYSVVVMMVVATSATRFDIIILLLAALVFVGREVFGLNQELRVSSAEVKPPAAVAARGSALDIFLPRARTHRPILTIKFTKTNVFLAYVFLLASALGYNVVGNVIRTGNLRSVSALVDAFSAQSFRDQTLMDLSYYDDVYDLYGAIRSGLDYDYGRAWFYYDLVSLIPRRLWAAKPITATSVRATMILHGQISEDRGTHTYTIYGEGFWQLGYLGVAVAPLLLLYSYYLVFKLLHKIEGSQLVALVLLFDLIPPLRAEMPIPLLMFESGILLVVILLSVRPVAAKKSAEGRDAVRLRVPGHALPAQR